MPGRRDGPSDLRLPLPAGHQQWNKIEHHLFNFISRNWRAKPLVSLEVIINLIAATSTRTGLEVYAQLDTRTYPDKVRITDAELAALSLHRAPVHPEWNCTIDPEPNNRCFLRMT